MEMSNEEFDSMLDRMGFSGANPKHLLKKNLSIEYKFLADIVGKVLLGKHTAHDYITRHQFLLMGALVNQKNINWGVVLFDCIKKKVSKMSVGHGRVLGIFLMDKYPEIVVSQPVHINASKRITCALFDKWARTINRPSRVTPSSRTSEISRAVTATPSTPLEEIPSHLSSLPHSTPSLQQNQAAIPSSSHIEDLTILEEPSSTLLSSPLITTTITTPEETPAFNSSPLPQTHLSVVIPSTSIIEEISSPHQSPIVHPSPPHSPIQPAELPDVTPPAITPPSNPPSSYVCPNCTNSSIPSSSIPSTSSQQLPNLMYIDFSAIADQVFEYIAPRLQNLIDSSLAPLQASINNLSTELSSFLYVPSSSGGLDPC